MKGNKLSNVFETISETINGAEKSFLDLLSALVPWAVPVIPAYLTVYHTQNEMGFPAWVAFTAGFVTEVLGIASVATAIKFYRHNLKYKDSKNHAPFLLAIGTYVFYLVIILTVNVLLEFVAGSRSTAVIIAIGLFSMLSLPSAVLISIRSQHAEILGEVEERKEERKAARVLPLQYARAFGKEVPIVELGGTPNGKTF
jgi:FlaA1/EpsC-like NDP-sugar epimerase